MTVLSYQWRGPFATPEVSALHAGAFGPRGAAGDRDTPGRDWRVQVERHSLGWACARDDGDLAGFLNVAWDGGEHAFILDTMVAAGRRRQGIGTGLVELAVRETRRAGCTWLHVDFEEHLRAFYIRGCGFTPSSAGLLPL